MQFFYCNFRVEKSCKIVFLDLLISPIDFQKRGFIVVYSATLKQLSKVARCLKITEKVSFNITSEASYVYILSGQK